MNRSFSAGESLRLDPGSVAWDGPPANIIHPPASIIIARPALPVPDHYRSLARIDGVSPGVSSQLWPGAGREGSTGGQVGFGALFVTCLGEMKEHVLSEQRGPPGAIKPRAGALLSPGTGKTAALLGQPLSPWAVDAASDRAASLGISPSCPQHPPSHHSPAGMFPSYMGLPAAA